MAILKQSTAYNRLFLLVATDHITGLVGASPSVNISKAGAAFSSAAGSVSEVAFGWYQVALTTADTGTVGDLAFHITAASADATDFVDQVVVVVDVLPANVLQVNSIAVNGSGTTDSPWGP